MGEVRPLSFKTLTFGLGESQPIHLIHQMKRPGRVTAVLSLLWLLLVLPRVSAGATLAGKPVQGGGMVEIRFPVAKSFQDLAAEGGNPRVDTGRAVLMFPAAFDPSRRWPILVVTSTSDFNRTNVMDAAWYRRPATEEGWVVLASDAMITPRIETSLRPES